MEYVGKFVLYIVSFILMIYTAFVAQALWDWFVLPEFGLVTPSLFVMAGIIVLIKMLTIAIPMPNSNNETDQIALLLYSTIVQFMLTTGSLIAGWLFHLLA